MGDVVPISQNASPEPPVQVVTLPRKNLREAVEDVFHELGGTKGMIDWVKESTANRRIFYKDILPKLIPKHIQGEFSGPDGAPMKMIVEWCDPTAPTTAVNPAAQVMSAVCQSIADDES